MPFGPKPGAFTVRTESFFPLATGERLFSSYDIDAEDETRLWIITEADRSVTTLLLPSDY
jgi:hypothetical protein